MHGTISRETIASLAATLDRLADEFTEAERGQLRTLLAVASAEVAREAGLEPEVEPFGMIGESFSDTFRPLLVTTAGTASLGPPAGGIPGGSKPSGSTSGGTARGGKS